MDYDEFTFEFLDILEKYSAAKEPYECYQELAAAAVRIMGFDICMLFVLQPYPGFGSSDLAYRLYCYPYACDASGINRRKFKLDSSCLFMHLSSNSPCTADISCDEYLKDILTGMTAIPDLSRFVFTGDVAFLESGGTEVPAAFILTSKSGNDPIDGRIWRMFKKVLSASVKQAYELYSEKVVVQEAMASIASAVYGMTGNIADADVLQQVLETSMKMLNAQKCALFLVDNSGKSLVLEKAAGDIDFKKIKGVSTYNIENYNPEVKETGVTPWVLFRKKPFNASSFAELKEDSDGHWKGNWDGPMYGGESEAERKFKCLYMVPLMVGSRAIGVLKYENRKDERSYYSKADERLIDIIGGLVTNLVVSQRIEREKYDYALPKILNILTNYFGQPDLYEKILDTCRELLNADICSLFIVENEKNLSLKAITGVSQEVREQLKFFGYDNYKEASGVTPWILQKNSNFNARNFYDLTKRSEGHHFGKWDEVIYHGNPRDEFKSLYSTPITIGDEALGVFKIENKNVHPYYFTESDELMFDLIGKMIAIAIKYEDSQYLVDMMHRAAEMGFMTAGISHEFKNYLQRFILQAVNIKNLSSEPMIKSKAMEITQQIEEAAKSIDMFADIRNREQEVKSFNLDKLFRQLLDVVNERFVNNNIQLIYSNEGIYEVVLNPGEMQTIIVNLLNNAFDSIIEARTVGKVLITVARDSCENRFCITVADTGTGISRENGSHLLSPFYTTKGAKGMGMGLYMVHRLVSRMSGDIKWINKNEHGGATFIITLPVRIEPGGM